MKAVVLKNKVLIYLSDNFVLAYSKSDSRVKINSKSVLWYSPITNMPVPVPIE
jgi:hypothetical protein